MVKTGTLPARFGDDHFGAEIVKLVPEFLRLEVAVDWEEFGAIAARFGAQRRRDRLGGGRRGVAFRLGVALLVNISVQVAVDGVRVAGFRVDAAPWRGALASTRDTGRGRVAAAETDTRQAFGFRTFFDVDVDVLIVLEHVIVAAGRTAVSPWYPFWKQKQNRSEAKPNDIAPVVRHAIVLKSLLPH